MKTVLERIPLIKLSMKAKMALVVSVLFVVSILAISGFTIHYFDMYIEENVQKQQQTHISHIAENIDYKLGHLQKILIDASKNVPISLFTHPTYDYEKIQKYLEQQNNLQAIFNRSVYLFDSQGILLAETPNNLNRQGKSYYYRKYIQDTLKYKKPVISDPFVSSRGTGEVVVMFTAPIFDQNTHELLGILASSVILTDPSIIGDLIKKTSTETNQNLYLTTIDRQTIIHNNSEKILKIFAYPGENPSYDRAIQGYQGNDEFTSSEGIVYLTAHKKLKNVAWIIGLTDSKTEALNALKNLIRTLWVVTIVSLLIVLSVIWFLMRQLLFPLVSFNDQIVRIEKLLKDKSLADLTEAEQIKQFCITVESQDEVQSLAETYNHMMIQLIHRERELRQHEQFVLDVINSSPNLICVKDSDNRYVFANNALASYLGMPIKQILDLPPDEDIFDGSKRRWEAHCKVIEHHKEVSIEEKLVLNNKTCYLITVKRPVFHADGTTHVMTVSTDISDRKEAQDHLHHLFTHDVLTNLLNRQSFIDRLNYAISHAKQTNSILPIFLIDLDRFKTINDTLGHSMGDLLLQAVASRLKNDCLPPEAVLARQGGDEFLLLTGAVKTIEEAGDIANIILKTMTLPFKLNDRELHINCSIGISFYPHDGEEGSVLISNADAAMYRAKEQGRDNYKFYTQDMNHKAMERLLLENNLRRAIEKREFILYYQPKVDLNTGELFGAEALIRWSHPESGLISPAEFIPLAEETGLIVPMGEWAIIEACRQIKEWEEQGLPPLRVAVNLSARQFYQKNLIDVIIFAINQHRIEPSLLELEITESMMMHDPHQVIELLNSLKGLGISLSIDDFGTGYSSLSYLKRFPIDTLKIDQSFVRDLVNNSDDREIVTALITMAHSLKLMVIAEGIETIEHVEFLKQKGCDEGQGYFYSRPLPARQFTEFVSKYNKELKQEFNQS